METQDPSLDLVDRLVAEYADRLARDEDPRSAELLAQAPAELRAELERCFRMLDGPGAPGGPGAMASGYELGGYRLDRELGRGGMAVVYEAEELSLRRRVALKVLRNHLTLDERQLERFQREARAAAKLRHDHVVRIHAVGQANGHAYIAFELVPGPTLARVIAALAARATRPTAEDLARETGQRDLAAAGSYSAACVRFLRGVFEAIAFAHRQGVVHRDLKPSNVLIDVSGRPVVADFGLAKDMGEASLSITGETIGTPHYMAPEQAGALSSRVDARTDVHALGVLLYELLVLKRPFEGRTFHEVVQHIVGTAPRSPSELAPDVPPALGDVVLKAMAKDPAARYASVAELADDLERALSGAQVRAQSSTGLAALMGGYFWAGMRGAPFEYRSRRALFGWPWIHVVANVRDPVTRLPKCARGVIAAGDVAVGFYAVGKSALGVIALGFIAVGPVAIGVLALGWRAIGASAVGWIARGVFAIGHSDHALLQAEPSEPGSPPDIARRLMHHPLSASLAAILVSVTMGYGIFARIWPADAARPFLRRVTCFWMPLCYLTPFALDLAGLTLPFMGSVLLNSIITFLFAAFVRRRLGSPHLA